MCLILTAWKAHPLYPVVIAANRDEFHARPTAAATWWPDRPQVLAGRDLQAGGTWLGVTRTGQIAALTNYRNPDESKPHAPSRGGLVVEMLESTAGIAARLQHLQASSGQYAGFNLLCTDGRELGVYESVPAAGRLLGPGIYGLSNHLLDTPWPKVERAKSSLSVALRSLPDDTALLDLLRDDCQPTDADLPRTGVSLEWERLLSSAFIVGNGYGTRSSTVILISADGRATFREWTWRADGSAAGEVCLDFELTCTPP
jgi:uncharacterized protein with NRDE domain